MNSELSEAEIVNFLKKTLDLTGELKRKKKSDAAETMKTFFLYHNKGNGTEAATAQLFIRILEPDGIFFQVQTNNNN